jgi:hypothetical protein
MHINLNIFKILPWYFYERYQLVNLPLKLIYLLFNIKINLVRSITSFDKDFILYSDIPLQEVINDKEFFYSRIRFERSPPKDEDDFFKICKYDPNLYKLKDAYTKSTRLTQSIKFKRIFKNSIKFDRFVFINVILILLNIEYRFSRTNNHIFNNSRALIYAGYYFKSTTLISIGINIWIIYLKKLVINGWLNEGSVHYQLVFNIWFHDVMEVISDLKLNNESDLLILQESFKKVCDVSNSFIYGRYIPKGDVSPDRSIGSISKQLRLANLHNINAMIEFGNMILKSEKIEICSVREPLIKSYIPSHKHHDEYSLEIYDGESKCLSDPGLISYEKSYNKYRSREYHTSLGFVFKNSEDAKKVNKNIRNSCLLIECEYQSFHVTREVKIENKIIYINDSVKDNKITYCQFILTNFFYQLQKNNMKNLFMLSIKSNMSISHFNGSYDYGAPEDFFIVRYDLDEPSMQLSTMIQF